MYHCCTGTTKSSFKKGLSKLNFDLWQRQKVNFKMNIFTKLKPNLKIFKNSFAQ